MPRWPWQPTPEPFIQPRPLVYLGSNTISHYRRALQLGDNTFTEQLDFIKSGEIWMVNSATIYAQTTRVAGQGDIAGYYGGISLLDPQDHGVTVCEGPIWRTDIGVDETNIQVPAFHMDKIVITCYEVIDAEDLVCYIVKFLKVQ